MEGSHPARQGRGPFRHFVAARADKPMRRPPQLVHGLQDRPAPVQAAALAAQQLAVQSIYLILPGVVGAHFGLLPLDLVRFLQLSVAAMAAAAILQALPRGPVGSGYPVPSIPSPVFVAVYLMAAPGADPGTVAMLTALTGILGIGLSLLLRRLQSVVPTEVAGVVVFLIGVSLLPRAFDAVADATGGREGRGALAVLTLGLMIAVALVGGRFSRYAVLLGAAIGTLLAVLLGIGLDGAEVVLADLPWFAVPHPQLLRPAAFDASLLPAFGVALLASFASWTGDLVAFQKAADGDWRRPDTPPIRRGLVAQSIGMVLAGGIGGMVPSTSSACVGLAIATRTLARRVAVFGAAALLVLACCPKVLGLIVLLPDPVEAAMLGYVCCFMLASGCGLMTSRMLDLRRTFTVGIGIALGIGALLGLPVFSNGVLKVLGSPVTAGAAAAIVVNLLTAPLIARRASLDLRLGPGMLNELDDWVAALGGSWGARRETMQRVGHALLEVAEVLASRGVGQLRVAARHADDQVFFTILWQGERLPRPTTRPEATDLEGSAAAQEAFALWLATRHATALHQRSAGEECELRLAFAD